LAAVFDSWYISIVRYIGKIAICLAGGLALCTVAHAGSVTPNNPYAPIVVRNVFDLNPPQPVDQTPTEPPPKITPNGIMTIFGSPQALFKAASPAKPGQPAKDISYILSEGQRQDDIEVVRIDEKDGIVTFNNHGTVQEIPLTAAPALTAPASFAPNPVPAMFAPMNAGNNHGENFGGRFGRNRGGQSGQNNGGGNFNGGYSGSTYNNSSSGNSNLQNVPAPPQIDPDTQKAMIVAQHLQAQQAGDPISRIYPPTDLDEAAGIVSEGAPPAP
jgi:hypothetical protein